MGGAAAPRFQCVELRVQTNTAASSIARGDGVRNPTLFRQDFEGEEDLLLREPALAITPRVGPGDHPVHGLDVATRDDPVHCREKLKAEWRLEALEGSQGALGAIGTVLEAVGAGTITPSEGQAVASLLEAHRRTFEVEELERRLEVLEAQQCAAR